MKSKVTIYEVARKANLSIATVSRALNPETRAKVKPETIKKIEIIAAQYGYTPSLAAKHLSRASYRTLGVLVPHHEGIFFQDYYSKVLCGVADALLESHYHLKVVMLRCMKPLWDKHNFKSGEGIDGLIVTHWHAFFSSQLVFENLGLPIVVINDSEKNVKAHFVSGDHLQGGRLAAEYLYEQGHRKIGIFTGSPDSKDSHDRVKGFLDFMKSKKIHIEDKVIACGHFQEGIAASLLENFLHKNKNLTALFCCNDGMAFGALQKMKELGLSCPGDLSIVGYDNDQRGANSKPSLTTISVPVYELAREAGRMLIEYLDAPKDQKPVFFNRETLRPVALVIRQSVRKIK